MAEIKKITASAIIAGFKPGYVILAPLVVRSCTLATDRKAADARLELELPGEPAAFPFVLEVKAKTTPEVIQGAISQVMAATKPGEWPMICVPFLSPWQLEELERRGVSGVDLCGNGLVRVPGKLYVMRTGAPNIYRDSRPLNNPFRGRSAMVARMLLQRPRWESLSELVAAIRAAGAALSISQASKAIQAMQEELLVAKNAGAISLDEPIRLLDSLGAAWRKPWISARQPLRLPKDTDWAGALSSNPSLQWAVTGESSVTRYTTFSQGGPRRIAVSDLSLAAALLKGVPERVPNFADIELLETDEPGFYFGNDIDAQGVRWASRMQTWLELQSGDGRQ